MIVRLSENGLPTAIFHNNECSRLNLIRWFHWNKNKSQTPTVKMWKLQDCVAKRCVWIFNSECITCAIWVAQVPYALTLRYLCYCDILQMYKFRSMRTALHEFVAAALKASSTQQLGRIDSMLLMLLTLLGLCVPRSFYFELCVQKSFSIEYPQWIFSRSKLIFILHYM